MSQSSYLLAKYAHFPWHLHISVSILLLPGSPQNDVLCKISVSPTYVEFCILESDAVVEVTVKTSFKGSVASGTVSCRSFPSKKVSRNTAVIPWCVSEEKRAWTQMPTCKNKSLNNIKKPKSHQILQFLTWVWNLVWIQILVSNWTR